MAELSTLARPYAEALFGAAQAQGAAGAAWQPALDALAAVATHPQVAALVGDPNLSNAQRRDLLAGIAAPPPAKLPPQLAELLTLLIENDRLAALPALAAQFRQLTNAAAGVADCLIESAYPLTEPQVTELLTLLGRKFPLKLKPQIKVEPNLIGGVRVTVGDRVLDSSVRARLDAMRAQLTA
jgi:F-type H+-transporting ATPase subunit delta